MIVCGDCLRLLRRLASDVVDHTITDPPYSPHVHDCQRRGLNRSKDKDLGFAALDPELRDAVAREIVRVTRRWILVFTDHEGGEGWRQAIIAAGGQFVRFGVWHKLGSTPQFTGDRPGQGHEVIVIAHAPRPNGGRMSWNGGGRHAFWEFPNRGGNQPRLHTTQKPLELMEALVRDFSNPADSILDPFAGSGTTNVAAKRLGRNTLGFERDPTYAATARKRWEETVEQAELFITTTAKPEPSQITLDLVVTPDRNTEPGGAGAPPAEGEG